MTPKDMLALNFGVPKDAFDAFPKGETYIQAGPVLPASEALDAPWPKESTHKFSLLHDNRAVRDFDGGTFRLATMDEWPVSQSMSGGVMIIKPGAMRKLHWNPNANEWHYYLRGKGQVALFGSGGRGKVAEFKPGDAAYIPQGFGHAIKNVGDEDLEIVQTWDNGKFEEIDLTKWVQSSPRYLLANNFAGDLKQRLPSLCRHKWRRSEALQYRAPSGVPIVPLIVLQTGLKIFQGHEQHTEHVAASTEVRSLR